jgi:PAS domain S-box-containing protein
MDILLNRCTIEQCPVINDLLGLLKMQRMQVQDVYNICFSFREEIISFLFENNIASKEIITNINNSVDKNLLNLTNLYHQSIDEENKCINEEKKKTQKYSEKIEKHILTFRLSKSGSITYINKNFEQLSGYTLNELSGQQYGHLDFTELNTNFEEIIDCVKKEGSWNDISQKKKKNGECFFLSIHIFPYNNELNEYIGICQDVSKEMDLNLELETTQKEIILKLGEVGESRSKETGNHVRRVALYSELLAKLYGLSYDEAKLLMMISPMHDIGKIGIPDSILHKPGKLDSNEWDTMQKHSEIGYSILKESKKGVLRSSAIVAYEHHEKWDGSGYPRGLKGEEIHIYGRITAMADVFDALASDRCYKKAWKLEDILNYFKEQRAKHFDPKLVDLFLMNLILFLEIRDKYKD